MLNSVKEFYLALFFLHIKFDICNISKKKKKEFSKSAFSCQRNLWCKDSVHLMIFKITWSLEQKQVGEFENARKMKEIYFTCQYLNNLGYLIKKIKNGHESLKLRNGGYWRKLSRCRSDHVLLWFLFAEKFFSINFFYIRSMHPLGWFFISVNVITYLIKCN